MSVSKDPRMSGYNLATHTPFVSPKMATQNGEFNDIE